MSTLFGKLSAFKRAVFIFIFFISILLSLQGCNKADCPLPAPFCGGPFPLNTLYTTPYGPPWANVSTSSTDFVPCFGPYALCYYADCTVSPGSNGSVVDCPCYETFGTNYVMVNGILNLNVYWETVTFCNQNPDLCQQPNQAPVCAAIHSGQFMRGADQISTFGYYLAAQEPIGSTDCENQPGLYAGCMTSPCYDPTTANSDNTTTIQCQCPTWDGPFQLGKDNLSCNILPLVASAAYNPNFSTLSPPPSKCDIIEGCIPDAPADSCGCGLYTSTTTLPPDSGVNCALVCQQYDSCKNSNNVELGYTCDATICTTTNHDLLFEACDGLQNCDLSEIFKAEKAAQCSCCGSQLCNCQPNSITNQEIKTLNTEQTNEGDTPQCDINGTLCGS